ncbi:MAG: DHA2 family efflux MFS transporter permease subunit [Candidatus Omnitrophota bacterium]
MEKIKNPRITAPNYFLILIAFALSIFLVRLDGYIVNLAVPTFVNSFQIDLSQASWVALSYILAQISAFILFGKLSDRFRLKNIFLLGVGVFTFGSFLCALSPNFWMLLFFRCIQGLGGSMMLVSAFASIMAYLPKEHIGLSMGVMTTSAAFGVLAGPLAGGFIINYFSWHWIFLVNVPIGILVIFFGLRVIPDLEKPVACTTKKIDLVGIILSMLALFLLIFALNIGNEAGWTSPVTWGCLLSSVVLFILFFHNEKKAEDPALDITLFKDRSFILVCLATTLGFLLFFGGNFLLPVYLTHEGMCARDIGLLLTVMSLVYLPIGLRAGELSDRIAPIKMVTLAMGLASVAGFIFVATLGHGIVAPVIVYLIALAVAYGLFFSPINHLIMGFANEKNRGSVSAMFNAIMNVTMALGVVLMETIYSEFSNPLAGMRAAFFCGSIFCLIAMMLLGKILYGKGSQVHNI